MSFKLNQREGCQTNDQQDSILVLNLKYCELQRSRGYLSYEIEMRQIETPRKAPIGLNIPQLMAEGN